MSNPMNPLDHQFEPHGIGYLYRRYPEDAPVRVSAAERDAYVEEFRLWTGRMMMTVFAVLLAGAVAMAVLTRYLSEDSVFWTLGPVAVLVGVGGWASYRVIRAPARADLPPPRPGALRFAEEKWNMPLAGYSYRQMALGASCALMSVMSLSRVVDGPIGSGWLWMLAAVAMLSPIAIMTLRKRREERG